MVFCLELGHFGCFHGVWRGSEVVKKQNRIWYKLEGVISSETANNAATGAAMIPLLALGLLVALGDDGCSFQMHDLGQDLWYFIILLS